MNHRIRLSLVAATLSVAAMVPLGASAEQVDCAFPKSMAQARGCEAARSGVTELRHFVQRSRNIYALNMADFDRAVPVQLAVEIREAPGPTKLASRECAPAVVKVANTGAAQAATDCRQ